MSVTLPPQPAIVRPTHKRFVAPWMDGMAQVGNGVLPAMWQGRKWMAIPHDETHVRLAKNFGIVAPAPILSYYDWNGGRPYQAQRETAAMLTLEPRAYVLNDMGTGKTRSVLWAYDWLRRQGKAGRLLVVAPLSTLSNTWLREVIENMAYYKVNVVYGSKERRLKMLAQPADIYIINHDGIQTVLPELVARQDIDTVVIDELAVYRNPTSKRFKKMRVLLAAKPRAWGLTGSPTPNAPTDAWAQVKLLTPSNVSNSFVSFRDQTMLKVSNFKWIPKPSALATVQSIMQPAVRYTLEDVVELPEVVVRNIDVPLGPAQQDAYTKLERHLTAMFDAGEVTAVNAGVLMNKLLQIATGWVYTNARGVIALDNDERLETLADLIESSDRKVLVFTPFIHSLDGISAYLTKEGIANHTVSGETVKKDRDAIFSEFQNRTIADGAPKCIVAHPQCMAHGLTLNTADTIVWFGPFASLETFEQANRRIRRIGQMFKQQIFLIGGTKVEKRLYSRLESRQKVQDTLLDMFRDGTINSR